MKVIHKSGKPDLSSLVVAISKVKEDHLFIVAEFSKMYKDNSFDETYKPRYKSSIFILISKSK
jgi:hypothetical protein